MTGPDAPTLSVQKLAVSYGAARRSQRPVPVVEDVSFGISTGETLGLVGESGSGKSTIVKAILGLQRPSAGTVSLEGRDITDIPVQRRRGLVRDLRVIFQDPFSSLSPFQSVGETLIEPLRRTVPKDRAWEMAREATESAGLTVDVLGRLPHEFSGGQRQRLALARALVSRPKVILMDEPVSALDLSTQAQVLNLLADLRDQTRYALLFVAHDLGAVRFLCQRVVVLYRGAVMEIGATADVTGQPMHPYTIALTAAVPVPRPADQKRRRVERLSLRPKPDGATASAAVGAGCPYAARCAWATDLCRTQRPELRPVNGRLAACHYV